MRFCDGSPKKRSGSPSPVTSRSASGNDGSPRVGSSSDAGGGHDVPAESRSETHPPPAPSGVQTAKSVTPSPFTSAIGAKRVPKPSAVPCTTPTSDGGDP